MVWALLVSVIFMGFFAFLWGVELAFNNKIMKENKELKMRLFQWDDAYNRWVSLMTAANKDTEKPRIIN